LLPGNGNPPLGVGETAQGPTAAAIANAIYDAIGVRVRSMPFTQEQIVTAMPD
jgi:CO/xanthine dehydrogenase Mo-binding subunit